MSEQNTSELFAQLESLPAEVQAVFAVRARHDGSVAPLIKAVSKEVRKRTSKAKLDLVRAERCNPESPKYDPVYAARVATRKANEGKSKAEKSGQSKEGKERMEALLKETGTTLTLAQVRKAQTIPLHNDDGSIRGYRGVVKIKLAGEDEQVFRLSLTKITHPDVELDQMKERCDAFIRTKLASFKA
jgi:hypothetical protein